MGMKPRIDVIVTERPNGWIVEAVHSDRPDNPKIIGAYSDALDAAAAGVDAAEQARKAKQRRAGAK